ncbi:1606_t:CDS:2 [Cetraspora pellucida]|uniref:1606_t:CDS:1 n=1 Tax=Cetraspora pellucida TaxID=1433469 RepID=A0A9N9BN99_9GLOM|nr:1606_t:CDS:2 [Cetraspora pellucida]
MIKEINGVMPYIAPEVLMGKSFTQAADIYSFGVIMSEVSTGKSAFYDESFNINLAVKIYRGKRPQFDERTPDYEPGL